MRPHGAARVDDLGLDVGDQRRLLLGERSAHFAERRAQRPLKVGELRRQLLQATVGGGDGGGDAATLGLPSLGRKAHVAGCGLQRQLLATQLASGLQGGGERRALGAAGFATHGACAAQDPPHRLGALGSAGELHRPLKDARRLSRDPDQPQHGAALVVELVRQKQQLKVGRSRRHSCRQAIQQGGDQRAGVVVQRAVKTKV